MENRLSADYKIVVIGSEQVTLGFKLSGIHSYTIADVGEAEALLRELLQDSSIGLIILGSGIVSQIRDRKLLDLVSSSILPMVIEIPALGAERKEDDLLRNLIMRAIGIDIGKNA